jgi:hypothetical protein
MLSGAVLVLVTRFTALMDDPLLPKLLRDLRDALTIEKADRARIADEIGRGKSALLNYLLTGHVTNRTHA